MEDWKSCAELFEACLPWHSTCQWIPIAFVMFCDDGQTQQIDNDDDRDEEAGM